MSPGSKPIKDGAANSKPSSRVSKGAVPPRGVRASRKAATRRLLSQSALTLFASKGFDGATAAEIAAAANVTERSFFLHFATKADALFDLGPEDFDDLHDRIVGMPAGLSDYEVLCEASIEYIEVRGDPRDLHGQAQLLVRSVASSPILRGKQFDENQMLVDVAANALAHRHTTRVPTLDHQAVALVVMRLLHESYLHWAKHGPATGFRRTAMSYFDAAREAIRI